MSWRNNLVDYRKVSRVEGDNGHSFASKLERYLHEYLRLLEKGGEVANIKCQDHVYLTEARIAMIPDFRVFDLKLQEPVWYEAKGYETDVYRLKRKLWTVYGPGRLRVYKGSGAKLFMSEEIIPRGPKLK